MSETWKDMDWDVTSLVKKAGPIEFEFLYEAGAHALVIDSALLLQDGREIGRDAHAGRTGAVHDRNGYRFTVPAPTPGARYVLRARIRSDGGTDSRGLVLVR